jgi:DNA modification methylase
MDKFKLHIGDALTILKTMPDQSVHCCVTSPPYWGLRDYGVEGRVWGGIEDCDHEWGDNINIHKGGPTGNGDLKQGNRRVCDEHDKMKYIIAGKFCQKCGAWFGCLGLEPTPELYVDHIAIIFAEVLRVLRDDGTLWLNLGDSYATGAGKVGNCPGGGDQGERFKKYGPARAQVPDGKNPMSGIPTYQPNRMPIDGLKPKDLVGIPWMVAFSLRSYGWFLRQDIIWHKPNPMPESVRDRCTKAHEYIFLFSKSGKKILWRNSKTNAWVYEKPDPEYKWFDKIGNEVWNSSKTAPHYIMDECKRRNRWSGYDYYYDQESIKESADPQNHRDCPTGRRDTPPGTESDKGFLNGRYYTDRNKRSVWSITTKPFTGAHFAVFPPDLIDPCILAGCPEGGTVFDPFTGSGTTGEVALKHFRKFIGIELNTTYAKEIAMPRMEKEAVKFKQVNIFE